ncbi:ATP-binding cassette domain-containing protein [Carboxydothermus pertinax]|uniref:ABC transporter ATP-binding protein n=1 Tax=Carboxydothermus pertinax TaxID=870242 RepID=A0A1L8CXF3_9THEO|nr:ATP-binding cassette domain-containing protein [Carboxydothermus pertinax]GAV23577.1 cobalt ABC transporter ATPase [Carboxydothermus pertinax]
MKLAVEIENLSFVYPDGNRALDGVSFLVPKGLKTVILGPNGAGKSTLLLHLNGLHTPSHGKVKIFGKVIGEENMREIRKNVGLVFQDPDDQLFAPTIFDDVAFGPQNLELEKNAILRRVEEALKAVDMWELRERPPHHLSLGQKKRAAIAGVLAMEPAIVVLDEPMAYLDPRGQEEITAILNKLQEEGKTVIVSTHDLDWALEWADYVVVLNSGRVVAEGDKGLLTNRRLLEQNGLKAPILVKLFEDFEEKLGIPMSLEEAKKKLKRLVF